MPPLLLALPLLAQTPAWTHRYNGPGGAGEAAEAMCRDAAGNVYLAGGDEERLIVVSVTPGGSERWHYHYSAHGDYNYAYAITCDPAGNVYVAGQIGVGSERSDFGVLALTSTGSFRWDYHCNGTGGEYAEALAIELGPDSNVYVCGSTESEATYEDITVVSLTTAGTERWRWDYDAGYSDMDQALDLTIGPDSNVYVCGSSRGSDTTYLDLTVLSLAPDGAERWVSRYMPPSGGYDVARAIAIGPDRRIYVAGASQPVIFEYQWCVACFDLDGSRNWVFEAQPHAGYNMAFDLAVDAGRVYACGRLAAADSSEDLAVVCVDTSGREAWTWTYDGPAHLLDIGYRLVLDSTGGPTVAGASYGGDMTCDMVCVSLTAAGVRRWLYRSTSPIPGWDAALTVLPAPGGVYCAGGLTDTIRAADIALVRLDPAGAPLWTYTYDSGAHPGSDQARCAAVAADGSSCIAGTAYWGATYRDFALVGLDPGGAQRWHYHRNGPGGFNDEAYSVIRGPDNNWYAAGRTSGTDRSELFTVVSVDNSGRERWVWDYGQAGSYNSANWLASGASGVYACGGTEDSSDGYALTVAALTTGGTLDWLYRLPNRLWGDGFAYAVTAGPAGSVWATGGWQTPGNDYCLTVVKLTAAGALADTWVLDPPHANYGLGLLVAPGPDGNVYVCGFDEDSLADYFTVASLTPACSLRWLYTAPEPGIATGLAFGPDSSIYACGALLDSVTGWDFGVVALDLAGTRRWKKCYDAGIRDIANSIAVGEDSCVYAAGTLVGPDDKEDYTVACLAPDGSERWNWKTRGTVDRGNAAAWITPGPDRTILVTGTTVQTGTWSDMFTAMFDCSQAVAGPAAEPEDRWLVPSHCRSALPVRFPRCAGPATLRLLDVTGRVCHQTTVLASESRAVLDLRRLPAGTYFVRLETRDTSLSGRTLKLD
jgi:hypothetical protein